MADPIRPPAGAGPDELRAWSAVKEQLQGGGFPLDSEEHDLVTWDSAAGPVPIKRARLAHDESIQGIMSRANANARKRTWAAAPGRPNPTYSDAAFKAPFWMSADGVTLFGGVGAALHRSTDDWQTTSALHTFGMSVAGVRVLGNGELMVSSWDGTARGELWVSSGYPTLGAAATWTKVLTASSQVGNYFQPVWGMSVLGSTVAVSEYGSKTPPTNPRYVYVSLDNGLTWTTVFDLGGVADAHVHGCALDPYRGWLWIATGDSSNRSIRYSTAKGGYTDWTIVSSGVATDQATALLPMPSCLLFGTDSPPNGVRRVTISFTGDTPTFDIDTAFLVEDSAQLTVVGGQFFNRGTGFPALLPFTRSGVGPGYIVMTRDGVTFETIWVDSLTYSTGGGPQYVLGPTASGKIVSTNNDGRFAGSTIMRMTCPALTPRESKGAPWRLNSYCLPGADGASNGAARTVRTDVARGGTFTGLTVDAKVARSSWIPAGYEVIASDYLGTDGQKGWEFLLEPNGKLWLRWHPNGAASTQTIAETTVTMDTVLQPDIPVCLRVQLQFNVGGVWKVDFSKSTDEGVTWSAIGAQVTGAAPTNLFSTTQPIVAGAEASGGTLRWTTEYHWLRVRNGGPTGTIAAGVDFSSPQWQIGDRSPTDPVNSIQTTYVDEAGSQWTLLTNARIKGRAAITPDVDTVRPTLPADPTDLATALASIASLNRLLKIANLAT